MAEFDPWGDPASRMDTEMECWRPMLQHADSDMRDNETHSGRARELQLTDPFGSNAVQIHRNNIVGQRLRLSLKPDFMALGVDKRTADEWAQMAEREFSRFAEGHTFDCDASRKSTFTGMAHIAMSSFLTNGEALAVMKWKQGQAGYKTCMMMVEPERLATPTDKLHSSESRIRDGVEVDADGAPIAYHIRRAHPHDFSNQIGRIGDAEKFDRVDRYERWGRVKVLHWFDQTRPDQTRGFTAFASVARQMKMLGDFNSATLEKQIIEASIGAVIKTELDYEKAMEVAGANPDTVDQYGNPITALALNHMAEIAPYHKAAGVKFRGSRIPHLLPGETLDVIQSSGQAAQIEAFETAIIRQLAAGLGVPYESLSRDFSKTSYSAARMALADIWRAFTVARSFLSSKFAMPFVSAWMEEAVSSGRLPLPSGKLGTLDDYYLLQHALCRGGVNSWGKPVIDPVKEAKADEINLANGTTTLEELGDAKGKDWNDQLGQRAFEKERFSELGLEPVDIDRSLGFSGSGGKKSATATATTTTTEGDGASE